MNKNIFKKIPGAPDLIFKDDERIETYREDTMMRGDPEAVLRARDEQDVKEALIFCNQNKIPLTFCASQTSMTGASVAKQGLLLSIEKLEGVLDIHKFQKRYCVTVKPGTVVADLQQTVAQAGFFYPIAPTSRDECRIGGNVSTNATGEDSFKYGALRKYVRRLRLILADGSEKVLERNPQETSIIDENFGGYLTNWQNPLDLIIGSEGTLAYIAEITLELLPPSPDFFSALIPFNFNQKGLEFLLSRIQNKTAQIRTLEFIDQGAYQAMKTADGFNEFPEEVQALVYYKTEYNDDQDKQNQLENLYQAAREFCPKTLLDKILVADTPKQKEQFRLWRHRIPEWANEQGHGYWPNGGGKVGSDWWVPNKHLLKMMNFFYDQAKACNLPHMAYAHLGRGHPHTNLIAKNALEKQKAEQVLINCCQKAVELEGGVAGEHGLGKLHINLLPIQYSTQIINKMKSWKKEYDPNWILGIGNIF